jgi:hypothetical protein
MDYGDLISIITERPQRFAWLLGAGSSRSAGLPTATDIIWDLKRRYYCREENQEVTQQDIHNDAVKSKIQSYMLSQGFPDAWADNEYSAYFERIFRSDHERQSAYLRAILSEDRVALSVGNRALGALMAMGHARVVFTTNFDSVVEKSIAEVAGSALSAFHLEGSYAANAALDNEDYPIYCKLHGDFRYESIKNLSEDLRSYDAELGRCLVNACNRFGLIVTGYSGRDSIVMALLESVLQTSNPFPHGLYWTGLDRSPAPASVRRLLEAAKARGVKAEHITIETFDALLLRLWRNLPDKNPQFIAKVQKTQHTQVSIPMPAPGNRGPIVRVNALPLILPDKCLEPTFPALPDWDELNEAERVSKNQLILTKADAVLMWGSRDTARQAFGDRFSGAQPYDISAATHNLKDHLYLKAFLEKALGRTLARGKSILLRSARHRVFLIADRNAEDQSDLKPLSQVLGKVQGKVPGVFTEVTPEHPEQEQVWWAEAAQIAIEEKDGRFWLVVTPDIWVWPRRARQHATALLDQRRSDRFNAKTDQLLSAWSQMLLGTTDQNTTVQLQPFDSGDEAENPVFKVGTRTAFFRLVR